MEDILDKDFKTTVLKGIKKSKEDVENVKKIMCEQNGSINKQKEDPKRRPKEILGMKSTVSAMRNSLKGFKRRFQQAEERISEHEDRTMKTTESEEQEGKKHLRKANRT